MSKCLSIHENSAGRPQALTEKKLLETIGKHQTRSPSELAEILKVSRRTIYNYLKEIPEEIIEGILSQVTDTELKPTEKTWEAFKRIDIVVEWHRGLVEKKKVSKRYARKLIRRLWRICVELNKNPAKLTVEDAHKIESMIEEGKTKTLKSVVGTRRTMRAWLMHIGVSKDKLQMEGLKCPTSEGKRATIRLSENEKIRFMEALNELTKSNFEGKVGNFKTRIPFKDKPDLALRMKVLPSFLYYTGTRKRATLNATWDKVTWNESSAIIETLDKGKGKGITWHKYIAEEFFKIFKALHEALGNPTEGRIFPFTENELSSFFYKVYETAEIPRNKWYGMAVHIWRHTACQDMLDASNRNFEMTARVLGWKSVDTMKKHYGEVSPTDIRNFYLESMGVKIERENKEFHFCQDINRYLSFFNPF